MSNNIGHPPSELKSFPPNTITIYVYVTGRWMCTDDKFQRCIATCTTGPLVEVNRTSTDTVWILDGIQYSFDEWCKMTNKSDDEIVELKLMYDTTTVSRRVWGRTIIVNYDISSLYTHQIQTKPISSYDKN